MKREEGLAEVENYDVSSVIPKYETLFENLLSLKSFKRESKILEGE